MIRAQRRVDQGGILGVVVRHHQHVGAGRELAEHQLGKHRHMVDVDSRSRVGEWSECHIAELLRPGVDQVQVELVPGQDAGQLQSDVPNAEDGYRGQDGQRVEQHSYLATAALHSVLDGRLVRQVRSEGRRFGRKLGEQSAGPVDGNRLDVSASDRAPALLRRDHHLRSCRAGRMPANGCKRHQHPRLPAGAQALDRRKPVHARQTRVRLGTPVYCRTSDSGWRSGAVGSDGSG